MICTEGVGGYKKPENNMLLQKYKKILLPVEYFRKDTYAKGVFVNHLTIVTLYYQHKGWVGVKLWKYLSTAYTKIHTRGDSKA